MKSGQSPREVWKRYRTSVYVPGCPCCGTVRRHRLEQKVQRRAKAKARLRSEVNDHVGEELAGQCPKVESRR